MVEPWSDYINCPKESGGNLVCLGVSAVYRMSFSLLCLFGLLFLVVLTRSNFAKEMNEGAWCLKITMVFGLFFLFFFIDDSFFQGYVEFAKVVGGIYLVFQSFM